jgi:glycosyltransferase-like protein
MDNSGDARPLHGAHHEVVVVGGGEEFVGPVGAGASGDGPERIALLTYSTKPRGGVVHTLALAEALARLDRRVTVWTLGRGGDTGFFRAVDPRVAVRVAPLPEVEGDTLGERVLRSIATLRDALAPHRDDYDVVHAQDCISANAAGRPVRTVHHLDEFSTPELVACHERALREPVAHLCVSAAVAAELRTGWGIEAEVIPNGVDAARFAAAAGPDPAAASARASWTARLGRYVLAVGGIEPRKGSRELLEAYAELRRAHPEVALVIAGGETVFDYRAYRADWQARADELGVVPVVLGPVPDPELPALVAAAEVFAFPSRKEGFGLAAMEALAAGVPLVAADLPVLRETFAGAAEFVASPEALAGALSSVMSDGPDPARTVAGRALAHSYTWDAAALRHLDFYRRLGSRAVAGR